MSVTGLNDLHIPSSKDNSVTTCMSSIKMHHTFLHLSLIILLHIPCTCKFTQL